MTISPQAREAYEAFISTREGIKARAQSEAAARDRGDAPKPSAPVVTNQKAALSALTETGTRLAQDFQKARESYRASDRAKALAEAAGPEREARAERFGAGRSEDDPFAPARSSRFGAREAEDARRSEQTSPWSFGGDPLKASTAIRAYERAGAMTGGAGASFALPRPGA